jgi:hypothetical protein
MLKMCVSHVNLLKWERSGDRVRPISRNAEVPEKKEWEKGMQWKSIGSSLYKGSNQLVG